ncbi:MAG: DUF4112 domain-containing protein, partial [Myxococcales bacterium]|nr:DUF4112 domain-containing protein [Myxococcales bacterium]
AARGVPLARSAPRTAKLVKLLDDYGLDPLIGFLVPGGGDVATGALSFGVLVTALREKVPTIILLRMLLNIAIDVVVGIVPIAGDLFDVFWRANRRNYALIERYRGGKERPGVGDYVIVGVGFVLATILLVMPALWLFGLTRVFGGLLGS